MNARSEFTNPLHDRVLGYIVVLDTPCFAKSGSDGRLKIVNVPDGEWGPATDCRPGWPYIKAISSAAKAPNGAQPDATSH